MVTTDIFTKESWSWKWTKKYSGVAIQLLVNGMPFYLKEDPNTGTYVFSDTHTNIDVWEQYLFGEQSVLFVNSKTQQVIVKINNKLVSDDTPSSSVSFNWDVTFRVAHTSEETWLTKGREILALEAGTNSVDIIPDTINYSFAEITVTIPPSQITDGLYTPNIFIFVPREITYFPNDILDTQSARIGITDIEPLAGTVHSPGTPFWTSTNDALSWMYIDLGQLLEVGYITIEWNENYATSFHMQISENSYTWETVSQSTNDSQTTNTIGITQATRFIKFQGITSVSSGYSIKSFNVYGRRKTIPVTPLLPEVTEHSSESVNTSLTRGTVEKTFTDTSLKNFIFKYKTRNIFTSVYPTDQGSTYALDIQRLETTTDGVILTLNTPIAVDINITVLLSLQRRIVHVSVPPSIRQSELDYLHDIKYLQLPPNQFFVVEPLSRTAVHVSAAVQDNNLSLHIKGTPWTTFLPLRITVYKEPYTFNTSFDNRLNIEKQSSYLINQTFDTPNEVQHKDLRVVHSIYNHVPISSETFILTLVENIPSIVNVITLDGDLVALDTPNESITFTSQVVGSRLEPLVTSSVTSTNVQVTVTLYRRTQFENSIHPVYNVHDYKFINKIVDINQPVSSLRNLTLTPIDNAIKIDVYGTPAGTVEFTPIVWSEEPIVNEIKGVAELFRQDVKIHSKKSVNISATDTIQLGVTHFIADKVVLGGGTILEFTVDTGTNEIVTLNPVLPLDITPGTFDVTIGSLQLENFITFNITIAGTPPVLTLDQSSLNIVGYTSTTVNMEIYVSTVGQVKTVQLTKFVGLPGSSITLNTPTDDKIFNDLEASDVSVTGLTISEAITTESIKTVNLFNNNDTTLALNANTTITSKNVTIGPCLNVVSDDLRLSLDSKYTLIDSELHDVIVGKEIFLDTKTDVLNIKKIAQSILPSIITLDTLTTTSNIYIFEDSGTVTKVGTLKTTNHNDTTSLTSTFNDALEPQVMLDKTYPLKGYNIDAFSGNMTLTGTTETGTTISKTFESNDGTKVLVETYEVKIVTGTLSAGFTLIRQGLSYNSNAPIESIETHTVLSIISIFRKASQSDEWYDREYKIITDGYITFHAQFKISTNTVTMSFTNSSAKIQLNNIKPGTLITGTSTFSGTLELRNNAPKIKTRDIEYTVFETEQFLETGTNTGLKTIHGTYVNSTVPVSTTFSRNTLSSEYQDQDQYDSFITDIGIVDITANAVFIFSASNGIITLSNFDPTEILPGTYISENDESIQITVNNGSITVTSGTYIDIHMQVQRVPIIKPHGPHDKYIPPQLLQLDLSSTVHTESLVSTPQNTYDIKYISPRSLLDFYCEGVWYPQFKLSDTYIDAHIIYINGKPRTTQITQLAVNPFENKKSLEEYSISLLATTRVQALKNAGISSTNLVQSQLTTNRDLPVENASSLSWIKSKAVSTIDYEKIFNSILDYTTLFDSRTDYTNVIETLKTQTPQATELRRALFEISPINVQFDKYVVNETEQYTQVCPNWSKGLQVVGDRYISRIKNAILNINNIEQYQLDAITNTSTTDVDKITFPNINGISPRYDFETSRVMSLAALIKHAPGSVKPGRWIKTGNTVWISADVAVPTIIDNSVYAIVGNPFSSVVRGVQVPIIPSVEFNSSNVYQIPTDLQYVTPSTVPDYILDTSESPLPSNVVTRVNTDGTITLDNNPKYTDLSHSRHKFCGTFNIVETFPDLPQDDYTIPQEADLSEYSYTLDDSGNETFAGYKLKGSPAQYNNGIYNM